MCRCNSPACVAVGGLAPARFEIGANARSGRMRETITIPLVAANATNTRAARSGSGVSSRPANQFVNSTIVAENNS